MIQIQNLHHHYPDGTRALKGIDLTVSDGEFLLLCGPNGSGKTTLIRIISGLLKPTLGSVHVNGFDPVRDSREVRRMVGMVFQDPDNQVIGETVREDVTFGPENLGIPVGDINERVDRSLQLMGLKNLSDKPCFLLSGGEKRRLAIAGVLAMKPQVILFDEPFSFLDYSGVQEVLKCMVDLHREGHTLVVSTHDVEKVIAHADRMIILNDGELKTAGPPEELLAGLSRFGIRPPCYSLLGGKKISWLE